VVADDDHVDAGFLGKIENHLVDVTVGGPSYSQLGVEALLAQLSDEAIEGGNTELIVRIGEKAGAGNLHLLHMYDQQCSAVRSGEILGEGERMTRRR
jgi:hypothetical protein